MSDQMSVFHLLRSLVVDLGFGGSGRSSVVVLMAVDSHSGRHWEDSVVEDIASGGFAWDSLALTDHCLRCSSYRPDHE